MNKKTTMPAKTIQLALKTLEPLINALEDAYWDSSSMDVKDRIFDLVGCVHNELNELAKLSVSDLDLPYQPITPAFSKACVKFKYIASHVELWFPRSQTAIQLQESIESATRLLDECTL